MAVDRVEIRVLRAGRGGIVRRTVNVDLWLAFTAAAGSRQGESAIGGLEVATSSSDLLGSLLCAFPGNGLLVSDGKCNGALVLLVLGIVDEEENKAGNGARSRVRTSQADVRRGRAHETYTRVNMNHWRKTWAMPSRLLAHSAPDREEQHLTMPH